MTISDVWFALNYIATGIATEAQSFWAAQQGHILTAAGAVLIAEMLRDVYHFAGHYWQPLQRWHNLHHKAYRVDLTKVSMEIYRQAELHNDVPEATFMTLSMVLLAVGLGAATHEAAYGWAMGLGAIYSFSFLFTAFARSQGYLLSTDITHEPGPLTVPPSQWLVNRTYHWRHHFDRGEAYFCGTFTVFDQILGTCVSLKGKSVAVTGASGSLGQALIKELITKGAKVIALTTSPQHEERFSHLNSGNQPAVEVLTWRVGEEADLAPRLRQVDILILNHGINVYGARDSQAVAQSYEVNAFSVWRWLELFLSTVTDSRHVATKEVWVNTSEAEVNPALSPLYELSKRTIGDLVTLRRLDTPCVIRKLILGPFKSDLNPYGVMSASFVAKAIIALAVRDVRNIIVTINPLTYLLYPVKELSRSLYFRWFTKPITERIAASHSSDPKSKSTIR